MPAFLAGGYAPGLVARLARVPRSKLGAVVDYPISTFCLVVRNVFHRALGVLVVSGFGSDTSPRGLLTPPPRW